MQTKLPKATKRKGMYMLTYLYIYISGVCSLITYSIATMYVCRESIGIACMLAQTLVHAQELLVVGFVKIWYYAIAMSLFIFYRDAATVGLNSRYFKIAYKYHRHCCRCGRPVVAAPIICPLKPHLQTHDFYERSLHTCIGLYCSMEFIYPVRVIKEQPMMKTAIVLKAHTSLKGTFSSCLFGTKCNLKILQASLV